MEQADEALTKLEGGSRRAAVSVRNLTKVYPGDLRAVDGITFDVEEGEVFGLLGPNGAGKSTTIKMIITLTVPTSGSIVVAGHDARKEPSSVRRAVGYVPQELSVDGDLTVFENLLLAGKLYHVNTDELHGRIEGLLDYFDLQNRKDELVKKLSGGMMRKLEIAQALVNRPRVLFLDEPTIGLDPLAKHDVWDRISALASEFNTAVVITTHDMSEADNLCDRIAIMDSGKIAIIGTPKELKSKVGLKVVTLRVKPAAEHGRGDGGGKGMGKGDAWLSDIATQVKLPEGFELRGYPRGSLAPSVSKAKDKEFTVVITRNEVEPLSTIIGAFERAGVEISYISASTPNLDDVFLQFAGKRVTDTGEFRGARSSRRSFKRHAR